MSLLLAFPAALAALAALAIPLLIHLARREQRRPTVFAALRWLRERPKPRRRIRFDEWPLLLLRLLLLALLALWLARPLLTGAPDRSAWTVVAAGVPQAEVARLLEDGAGELRWLAPGFPPLSGAPPAGPQPLSSLLRQLDAELSADSALTVVVPAELGGLDAAPLRLSRTVDWRVLEGASPGPAVAAPAQGKLVVRHGDDLAPLRYLRAAALAPWPGTDPGTLVDAAPAGEPLPGDARRLVWLAPGEVPAAVLAWVDAGGTALLAAETVAPFPPSQAVVLWRAEDGSVLVEAAAHGRGRLLRLARPWQPAALPALLEADFPHRFAQWFEPPHAPTRARAADAVPAGGLAPWPEAARDLQPWLALLIALLALLERWLAASPRRGAAG